MEDRRWSMGIHEAIEIKENVTLGNSTKTKTSITYQNFFTLYPKLAGMTGTAKTTEKEFKDIYNLNVVVLPTAKPMIRKDLSDLVYQTELTKWKAVLEETKKAYKKGQPILIGTATVEKSEFLSELFKISGIQHQVLNAKPENVKRENEIVAQAGRKYAVTIATNMAGRGTDIILGGNPTFQTKQKLLELIETKIGENEEINALLVNLFQDYSGNLNKLLKEAENLPYSLETSKFSLQEIYKKIYNELYKNWKVENKEVKDIGGLFILGTERHETRRIDNQLRGRSGRQGDPGISQFFVSLEDELIKIFGGDSIKKWVEFLMDDKDAPLESQFLTNSLENAQKKIELFNYDLRKNIFQYDEILNSQRKQLFKARREILTKNIYSELFLRSSEELLDEDKKKNSTNIEKLFGSYSMYRLRKQKTINKKSAYKEIWITNDLKFSLANFYEISFLKNKKSVILLTIIDFFWTQHIERTSYIRETINWRSYGQQNPLLDYNIQAFLSYRMMFEQIRSSMIYYFLNSPTNY
jgi:preprotein translocase subunit SecA